MNVTLTEHAVFRAMSRMGLRRDSLQRLADRAIAEGITHADASGPLKKYFDSLYFVEKTANNIRIYGDFAFIFHDLTLITVHGTPQNLKRMIAKLRSRKEGEPRP
jgi:hypothetical protein